MHFFRDIFPIATTYEFCDKHHQPHHFNHFRGTCFRLRIHLQNTKHLRWNNHHHPMCSAHLTEIDFEYHCCWQWNVSVAPHSPCRWPKTGHPCHPEKGSLCQFFPRQINDDSCAFMHNFVWFLITIYIGKGGDSTCFNLLLPISNLPKTSEHQRSQLGPPLDTEISTMHVVTMEPGNTATVTRLICVVN